MQVVKEKLNDMATVRKVTADARAEEKVEKDLAKTRVEVAKEIRKAKEAEAAKEMHVAKAEHKVDQEMDLPKTRVEVAKEIRKAKDAEAAKEMHVAKAQHRVDQEISKHGTHEPHLTREPKTQL